METPETRWLDHDEQQTWLAFAYALHRLPGALDAQLQREAGIGHFEYLVLSGLSMTPERTLRMSDLAEFTASSLSRLSNVVARLEKRGWVRRTPDPTDGHAQRSAIWRLLLASLTALQRHSASVPGWPGTRPAGAWLAGARGQRAGCPGSSAA